METSTAELYTSFYIIAIQKLAFQLPNILILDTIHCGNTRREVLNRWSAKKYLLCRLDYAEIVVASFTHQIHYEYYGGNRSVYIEGIALEHFSVPTKKIYKENQKHAYVMLCFIHFFLMTANIILPQLLHTENASLKFWINETLCRIR